MTNKIEYIAIDKLVPHPDNPRKDVGDIAELAESIRKQGVLQNLTVVPVMDEDRYTDEYRVVIGHRRLAAAKLAGLRELPCSIATDMDYKTQLATMLSENMQRSDLTLLEQVEGIQMMLNLGESVEAVSDATGLSESTVRRRAKLAELPRAEFRAASERGGRLEDYARLGELTDPENRKKALKAVGTPNFDRVLEGLRNDEKWAARRTLIVARFIVYATKADKRPDGYEYVCSYDRWGDNLPPAAPVDAERKYVYCVDSSSVTLYAERTTVADADTAAQEEREAKVKARREALDTLTKQAYERRRDFVLGMSPAAAAKHADKIICAIAEMELTGKTNYRADDALEEYLGLDEEDEANIIRTVVEKEDPSRLLLLLWYAETGDIDARCYYTTWGELKPMDNDYIDRVYDTLIAMGYEPTADEQALRDGTHELFGEIE